MMAPRLRMSNNQRFMVHEGGRPFFYLGDIAWVLVLDDASRGYPVAGSRVL